MSQPSLPGAVLKFLVFLVLGALLWPALLVIGIFRKRVGERIVPVPFWIAAALGVLSMVSIDHEWSQLYQERLQKEKTTEVAALSSRAVKILSWQREGPVKWLAAAAVVGLALNYVDAGARRRRGELVHSKDVGRSRLHPVPSHALAVVLAVAILPLSFVAFAILVWGIGAALIIDLAWYVRNAARTKKRALDEADALAEQV